jgi:tetratricopeptide (TPR) repeat protein
MKPKCLMLALSLVAGVCVTGVLAHQDDATSQSKPKGEKLGTVLFKTSCTAEAQQEFEHALALLHSFYFPETVKAFSAIPQTDPSCAIAYWGIAVSTRPNPLVGPWDAATLKRGLDTVEKGKAIGAKTERERDWLAAIEEFYKNFDTIDQDTRTRNYERAMEALAKKYPDDVEAKIFHALALIETFDHKSMEPLLKAINILEPLDKQYPEHPGITHYLIHSYDFAPLAKQGLPAANKYARIAPSAPHAQHMPSHIYTMLGMWQESIDSNLSSVKVANEYAIASKLDGTLAGVLHSYDFMEYAYLQLGQDAKAQALIEESAVVKKIIGTVSVGQMARAAVPARYMLERQDWQGAAQLQPLGMPFPAAEAVTHFARAMGAARSGNFAAAQADIDKLKALRAGLEQANQPYWAEQVEVQILCAQAWIMQGQGNKNEALKFMREAADLEDSSEKDVAMENRLYPMRELLGDMLREQGQPAAALKEYEISMQNTPNRLRGYYGAAKAAAALGDQQKAATYMYSLTQLTHDADSGRAEIREAKQ